MAAILLDGEALAARERGELSKRVAELKAAGVTPGLGTILVGDDEPSARYVAMKHQDCAEIGVESVHEELPGNVTQGRLESVIRSLSANPEVDALLIQLPLPKHLNEERALLAVDPDKDVDGLHPVNLGRLVMGAPGPLPCTPAGIVELLHAYNVPVSGPAQLVYRGLPFDEIEDLLPKSVAYRQAGRILFAEPVSAAGRPLTPLHAGHLGLLAVSSMLDGIFGADESRHISAWRCVKVVDKTEEEDEDGIITLREKERFSNELTLVFTTGQVATLK